MYMFYYVYIILCICYVYIVYIYIVKLYYIILYHIILYYIILYYIILYCILLYFICIYIVYIYISRETGNLATHLISTGYTWLYLAPGLSRQHGLALGLPSRYGCMVTCWASYPSLLDVLPHVFHSFPHFCWKNHEHEIMWKSTIIISTHVGMVYPLVN